MNVVRARSNPVTTGEGDSRLSSLLREPTALVDLLGEVVFVTDCSGRWVFLNPAWTRLSGYQISGSVGRTYIDFVHPDDRQQSLEAFLPVVRRERETARLRVRLVTSTGEAKWVSVYLRGLFSGTANELQGAIGTIDDITELVSAERVMREARDRAELADRTKSEFLATMSHELRTPMNAIIGLTDLVLGTPLDADQNRHLKMVASSASSLLEIIDDILLFSNLEAGLVEVKRSAFDLRDLVGQAVAPLLSRALDHRIEIAWKVDAALPARVIGPHERLKQVVHQLVGNAVKLCRDGSIRLEVVPAGGVAGERSCIRISITTEAGSGSADYRAGLRAALAAPGANGHRRQCGAGVALTLSVRILGLMGGRIWVDNDVESTGRFHLELPVEFVQDTLAPAASQAPVRRRILVAEDNTVNQHLIRHMLIRLGHEPRIVANGRLCVKTWEAEGDSFDAILMDVQMPEMSGLEATRAIRDRERALGRHMPIIAVTANAVLGDREICLASGMDDYITKPVKPELLQNAIVRLTAAPLPAMTPDSAPPVVGPQMNFERALEGADNDPDLLRGLMESFQLRTPECVAKLVSALETEDASAAMLQAHSLKGSLRMLCADPAEAIAQRIEKACRNRDLATASAALKDLRPALERLAEEIRDALRVKLAGA